MDTKEKILDYYDRNPGALPEDLVADMPEIDPDMARSYLVLWRKLAAWKYEQGVTRENLALAKRPARAKKEVIKELKLPTQGLASNLPQVIQHTPQSSQPAGQPTMMPGASVLPPALAENLHFFRFIAENQSAIISMVEQYRQNMGKTLDFPASSKGSSSAEEESRLLENLNQEMLSRFIQTCEEIGLSKAQGLNIAIRDFLERFAKRG